MLEHMTYLYYPHMARAICIILKTEFPFPFCNNILDKKARNEKKKKRI